MWFRSLVFSGINNLFRLLFHIQVNFFPCNFPYGKILSCQSLMITMVVQSRPLWNGKNRPGNSKGWSIPDRYCSLQAASVSATAVGATPSEMINNFPELIFLKKCRFVSKSVRVCLTFLKTNWTVLCNSKICGHGPVCKCENSKLPTLTAGIWKCFVVIETDSNKHNLSNLASTHPHTSLYITLINAAGSWWLSTKACQAEL